MVATHLRDGTLPCPSITSTSNHGLELRVYDSRGEVTDRDGSVIAEYERKWSTKKVNLTYKELLPSIQWKE